MFSTTEAIQLLKLPLILQHYKEHKATDNSMGFIRFIDIHYLHECPKAPDYSKDMQLPFKTVSRSMFSITSAIVPSTTSIINQDLLFDMEQIKYYKQNQKLDSTFPSNIWQPPRIS